MPTHDQGGQKPTIGSMQDDQDGSQSLPSLPSRRSEDAGAADETTALLGGQSGGGTPDRVPRGRMLSDERNTRSHGSEPSTSLGRRWLARSGRSLSVLGERIQSALPASPDLSRTFTFDPAAAATTEYFPVTGNPPGITANIRNSHPHARRDYDAPVFQDELLAAGGIGNGVRVWYESYSTIDWIHDAIKESSRRRRLRGIRGVRGKVVNLWDRMQGWLIVTLTGILTAFIAGGVVQSEAVLFDFKEGYCQRNWRLAKRYCCPYADQPDYDHGPTLAAAANNFQAVPRWLYKSVFPGVKSAAAPGTSSKAFSFGYGSSTLAGWAGPVAGSPAWRKAPLSFAAGGDFSNATQLGSINMGILAAKSEEEYCSGWITWSEKLSGTKVDSWVGDYGAYIAIAVFWASIASLLTVYLTNSELYLARPSSERLQDAVDKSQAAPAKPKGYGAINGHTSGTASKDPLPADEPQSTDEDEPPLPSRLLSQIAQEQRAAGALAPRKVLYFGSGSGISEIKVILSGFVIHGYLGFWTLFTKAVGLTLSVASGLSLGKEGPFVHMASCVGNIVCRFFTKFHTNEAKRREMLSCACAAGVAVAFGAPVGGVLFSLEEVSSYFPAKVMFRSFFCAMIAAATLRVIDPFGTGKIVLFQVTYDKEWHFYELVFFVLIGVFGGIYGAVFTKLNMLWAKNVRARTWMAKKPVSEVVMITIVTAIVSFFNGYMRMGGAELIADLFSECHEHDTLDGLCVASPSQIKPLLSALVFAMLAKGALTIITFGIKLPAGIFIPTLAVGALFGRFVGLIVQYVQWTHPELGFFGWCKAEDSACIVPGIYAMVGAAAALSGVTRTTVSLVVIMFELTGTLTYSIPVMLSVLIARTIADGLEHKGIYDLVIDFSGLPYLDSKAEYIWSNVAVPDAMENNVEVISLDQENTVHSLQKKLERLALGLGYTDGGFPIVLSAANRRKARLAGYIAAPELAHALAELQDQDPKLRPKTTQCTFNNIAYMLPASNGEDGGSGSSLRDSTLFVHSEPTDLSRYVDKAPISVQTHSPLELVHQYFTKLGVRYLIVVDEHGYYKGVIFKKRYLKFLETVESGVHA